MTDPALLLKFEFYKVLHVGDVGTPIPEAGASGMKGSRGVLVPSVSSPGTLSVLWLQDMGGRMQTSVTYGTVPDIDTRLGFLLLVDYCEQGLGVLGHVPEDAPDTRPRDVWSTTEIRSTYWWDTRENRDRVKSALMAALAHLRGAKSS